MPLHVTNLRESSFAAIATDVEFRAGVLLWAASWHQIPAGSLPTDDRLLAHLAGFGRDVPGWQQARPGAMRGWHECRDGRLYHALIATEVRRALATKRYNTSRTQRARETAARNREFEGSITQNQVVASVTDDATTDVTKTVTSPSVAVSQAPSNSKSQRECDSDPTLLSGTPPSASRPDELVLTQTTPKRTRAPAAQQLHADAERVLATLNRVTRREFRAVNGTLQPILARLREGMTAAELELVVRCKASQWLEDAKFQKYLRPQTLFGDKCGSYLEEAREAFPPGTLIDDFQPADADRPWGLAGAEAMRTLSVPVEWQPLLWAAFEQLSREQVRRSEDWPASFARALGKRWHELVDPSGSEAWQPTQRVRTELDRENRRRAARGMPALLPHDHPSGMSAETRAELDRYLRRGKAPTTAEVTPFPQETNA